MDSYDIGIVTKIQRDILAQYRQDISKYTLNNKTKINNI